MEETDLLTTIKHGQNQAEMYLFQGNITQALCAIQLVLNVAPASAETLKILGNIQQKQGNLIEAKHSYLQAIELEASFAPAYANLGSIYALEKNWQEAIQYYQQALQLQPDLVGVYRNLAKIWQELGNEPEFYKCHYYVIMADNNRDYYDYVQLGHKLLKIGEKEKAIDCYYRCLAIHPEHFIVLAILGDLAKEEGDFEKALKYYEKSLETHANPANIYSKIGDVYLKQENLDQALFYFIESLKHKTDFLESHRKIRYILYRQGKLVGYINRTDFDFPGSAITDFLSLPENWFISISSIIGISHQIIYPTSTIDARPSLSINRKFSPYMKSEKLNYKKVFVTNICEGIAYIDYMNLIFKTKQGQVIPEISVGLAELIASLPVQKIDYYTGKTVILSSCWRNNYFHWMFDIIGRIHLLLVSGLSLIEIDQFVVNDIDLPYCQETLAILGIDLDRVICSGSLANIQSENLIIPSYPFVNGSRMSKWVCEFLRSLFIPRIDSNFTSPDKIYISRSLSERRRILNEEQVINFLENKGFTIVFLESMSLLEQVSYFAKAKVFVAPHGAGLTNLVFSQPGTKIIELFPMNYVCNLYWQLCQACNLEHYHLVQNTDNLTPEEINNQDFFVNINDLSSILEIAGIK